MNTINVPVGKHAQPRAVRCSVRRIGIDLEGCDLLIACRPDNAKTRVVPGHVRYAADTCTPDRENIIDWHAGHGRLIPAGSCATIRAGFFQPQNPMNIQLPQFENSHVLVIGERMQDRS